MDDVITDQLLLCLCHLCLQQMRLDVLLSIQRNLSPLRRRKVRQDPNQRLMSLPEVPLLRNQTPVQHIAREGSCIVIAEEEEGEESEEEPLRRQSARVKRPSQRYLDQDLDLEGNNE